MANTIRTKARIGGSHRHQSTHVRQLMLPKATICDCWHNVCTSKTAHTDHGNDHPISTHAHMSPPSTEQLTDTSTCACVQMSSQSTRPALYHSRARGSDRPTSLDTHGPAQQGSIIEKLNGWRRPTSTAIPSHCAHAALPEITRKHHTIDAAGPRTCARSAPRSFKIK